MPPSLLSILIPVHNESECILLLYDRLTEVAKELPCEVEFLFVNDGSSDNSLSVIRELHDKDSRIACIDLSRNFGKEIALCAGIDYIQGDALVIIDADLQHPPELIPEMLEELEKGYDDVYACRTNRKTETRVKKWSATIYYKVLKNLSNFPVQENAGDFRMFSKRAIAALRELKENERNMKGLFSYIGFNKKPVYYEPEPRIAGKTKWNYLQLTHLAIKGLTSFSTIPLRIISIIGGIVSLFAFVYLSIIIIKALLWGDPVAGYPSLMSVLLFMGGVILLALGIIGEYIGIIYNETKKRPAFFVKEYLKSSKERE